MNTLEMPFSIDLDAAIDQAVLFIRPDAVIGLLDECAGENTIPADPYLFRDARSYLAHEMVEEVNGLVLDSLSLLELRCRKEEVRRRLVRSLAKSSPVALERKAA
jgi:hypothetical protein